VAQDETQVNGAEDMAQDSASSGNKNETTADVIEALQVQVTQFREGWQRERAEFANFKRRIERETKDTYQNASADVLIGVLPIIDDFERALNNVPDDLKDHPWLSGTRMIQRKFVKMLEEFGVTTVDPTGDTFDPNLHQAIGTDDAGDGESGRVTKTELKGYVVVDRVLRPALVRVSK